MHFKMARNKSSPAAPHVANVGNKVELPQVICIRLTGLIIDKLTSLDLFRRWFWSVPASVAKTPIGSRKITLF